MQLFVTVLTKGDFMSSILETLSANNFHGSVLSTQSLKDALMTSIEPEPFFGGLNHMVEKNHEPRPMVFVVVKNDEQIQTLIRLVNQATGGITNKGFMYSIPVNYLEGITE